jgi:hypothetical protein
MYRLSQQPLLVTLDDAEVQQTLEFIARMREDKVAHNVVDKMFDINNTSEGINIIGHLGEMAVGKVLNIPVDMEVRTGGDDGNDMYYRGNSVQVKTSTLRALIFNAPHLFKSDIAMLVQFIGADKRKAEADPRFAIWGWVSREEFLANHYNQDYGYGNRLVMDAEYLAPLSDIEVKEHVH